MAGKFDARNLSSALIHLKNDNEASAASTPLNAPLSDQEWQQREGLKVKMIEARVKLQLMRDRTEKLKLALARFREYREIRA